MFRPDDVVACVTSDLVNDPARTYPVFPEKRPLAIPVESQEVSIWSSPIAPGEIRLDVVIADFSHCEFEFILSTGPLIRSVLSDSALDASSFPRANSAQGFTCARGHPWIRVERSRGHLECWLFGA